MVIPELIGIKQQVLYFYKYKSYYPHKILTTYIYCIKEGRQPALGGIKSSLKWSLGCNFVNIVRKCFNENF